MKTKLLIFCQAPADVSYTLTIYEKYIDSHSVHIYVINVKGVYEFLKDINLSKVKITFINYNLNNLKSFSKIYSEKKRLNLLFDQYFSKINNSKIFFFSRFEDWITSFFIHKASKNKKVKIFYCNHYDQVSDLFLIKKNFKIKVFVYLVILKYITGIWFKAKIRAKIPELNTNNYSFENFDIKLKKKIFEKYSYEIDNYLADKKKILFFLSPCDSSIFNIDSYQDILFKVLKTLKKYDFSIFLKGHPRIGLPSDLDLENYSVIPTYVPGEFINLSSFDLILGIDTNALVHPAISEIKPTFSLMKIFPAGQISLHNTGIKFLNQQSKGKIKYITSLDHLIKICLNI
jgi:hypothetical protein